MPPLRRSGLLTMLLAALSMPAQSDVRRPTFVRVLDVAGAPIASALVTFAGCLPHLGAAAGPSDVQQVQSDARGRVVAKLQDGLCYVAWAVGPADAQGAGVFSQVRGFFGAGALLQLCCATGYGTLHCQVEGAAAWAEAGPLQFVALTSVPGSEEPLAIAADGTLTVPPGPSTLLEVRSRDGQPLWSAVPEGPRFVVPPPQAIAVRVVDERGLPLPGAVVRQRVTRRQSWRLDGLGGVAEDRYRDLAVVDADGRATVHVAYPADPLLEQGYGDLLLFAGSADRPAVAGGICNRALYASDHKVREVIGGELCFVCRRVEPLCGGWRGLPQGTTAHLSAVCKLFTDEASYLHDARAFVTTVDANGRFAFADLPAELHSCRLTLLAPPGRARGLPLFPAMPGRELPVELTLRDVGEQVDSGAALASLTTVVTEPDGGPARGVVAFIAPADLGGVRLRDSMVRFPLDARGSSTLRLVAGKWVVLASSTTGWVAQSLILEAGERTVTMAMQALAIMHLQLRDQAGRPIAGARPRLRGTATRGTDDPVSTMLQGLRIQTPNQWATLQTDGEGRLELSFVPVPGMTQRLCLDWPGGSTPEFVLEANDGPVVLRPQ